MLINVKSSPKDNSKSLPSLKYVEEPESSEGWSCSIAASPPGKCSKAWIAGRTSSAADAVGLHLGLRQYVATPE